VLLEGLLSGDAQVHCSRKPPRVEVRGFEPLTPCLPSTLSPIEGIFFVPLTCTFADGLPGSYSSVTPSFHL